MKKTHLILAILLPTLFLLAWFRFGADQEEIKQSFKDENSARQYLKAQVAEGNMTEIEARVRLAEALVQVNKKDRKKNYIRKIMEQEGLNEDEVKDYLIKLKQEKSKKQKFPKSKVNETTQETAKETKGK